MAIRYECGCGANIRMPVSAAGRKARCQACGAIFTVPGPDDDPDDRPIPLEGGTPEPSGSPGQEPSVGGWLADFAREEKRAGSNKPVVIESINSRRLTKKLGHEQAAREQARTSIPRISGRLPHEEARFHDAERSGIITPEVPFWEDLLKSFLFPLDASNLVTYLILGIAPFVCWWIPMAGPFLVLVLQLYIAAFCMEVIRETAAGEDRLPETLWMSSAIDLLSPLFQFLGATALAMLPAAIYVLVTIKPGSSLEMILWHFIRAPQMPAVQILAAAGLLFWPIIVLAVAIGGSFSGLWPHIVVRTVLCAPAPYLAMCGTLLIAAVIWILPSTPLFDNLYIKAAQLLGPRGLLAIHLPRDLISLYGMIVAMRTIGLYYRHFKHKFPWAAE
ncbi:MAG: hypothetical protein ACUVXJ_13320 [Phycisphaerae bacterium]